MKRSPKATPFLSQFASPPDWLRYLLLLLIGFGFAYAIGLLIQFGSLEGSGMSKAYRISWAAQREILFVVPAYFNLCIAGCFGGLLHSMLTQGSVDLPSLGGNGDQGLKPGFLGDCAVGIVGALIAFLALPDEMKKAPAEAMGILVFSTGLVGGYGGKDILDRALKRLLTRIEIVDAQSLNLIALSGDAGIEERANKQINHGLPAVELSQLQQQLSAGSLDSRTMERILARARDARRLGSRVPTYSERTNRVLPILEAIAKGTPNHAGVLSQLGCAYRDCQPPRLQEAMTAFNRAIDLQQKAGGADLWPMQLDRLVALILAAEPNEQEQQHQAVSSRTILQELVNLNQSQGLQRLLLEYDDKITEPIRRWLAANLDWIWNEKGGSELVQAALSSQLLSAQGWNRVVPIAVIKATRDTHLKRLPIQAMQLAPNQKVLVKAGKTFPVIQQTQGPDHHWLVELGEQAGIWYLWTEHWQLPWSKPASTNSKGVHPATATTPEQARTSGVSSIPIQSVTSPGQEPIQLQLSGTVGRGGANRADDVVRVKQRLKALGFDWFNDGSEVDAGFLQAIKLFQSIINGLTDLGGDGIIDVNEGTHQWLQAANAPRWMAMPIEGVGYINYERKDNNDNHDYGTSWLADVIVEAGQYFEQNYRRGNSAITPMPINDVSVPHGGRTQDHAGHQCGNACDVYLPRKDGGYGAVWDQEGYDRDTARAIIKALRAQPLVLKDRLFFNDSQLISEGLCRALRGHHHHIHFEIGVPDKVVAAPVFTARSPASTTTDLSPTSSLPLPTNPGDAQRDFQYCYPPITIAGRKFIVNMPANHLPRPLSASDYQRAAAEFGLDVAVLHAVLEVESSGHGFLEEPAPARPKILFEAHWFYSLTPKPVSQTRPDLSSRNWNRNLYKGGAAEWTRLFDAMSFDPIPALQSASWGLGQVMGFNHKSAGCRSVEELVEEAHQSEYHQLRHMLNFCQSNNLIIHLRNKDWHAFASGYNGAGYRENNYHGKLAASFSSWSSKVA